MKPKVAFYWCASCGGCEECILDLAEEILPVLEAIDIVFWPVALDFKENDLERIADGAIDVAFLNGAIRTTEQKHMASILRAKAKTVVAFGACAQLGGIPGLANLTTADEILDTVGQATWPIERYGLSRLPELFDTVLPLDRVVPVDYYIPGCPPTPSIIKAAFGTVLSRDMPPKGTVLAPDRAMCQECPRRATRPTDLLLDHLHRVHECAIDPSSCILSQGVLCLGPATRAGCEARCITGNMPCTGCFGPMTRVREFGGKALSAIASLLSATSDEEIERALDGIADPVGTFYRYSLPASFLERKAAERV